MNRAELKPEDASRGVYTTTLIAVFFLLLGVLAANDISTTRILRLECENAALRGENIHSDPACKPFLVANRN